MKNILNLLTCKTIVLSLLVFVLLSFSSCERKPISIPNDVLILGHRAARTPDVVGNSFEAVKYGCAHLDGIEIDIMMSKDTTLWLIHDYSIVTNNKDTLPVASLTDSQLRAITQSQRGTLVTLKEVFSYLSHIKKRKIVSLDLKLVFDPHLKIANRNEIIVQKISKLYDDLKPNAIIAIESLSTSLLKRMKQCNPKIETYRLKLGKITNDDIEEIISNKIGGLSCSTGAINKHLIDSLKTLKIKTQIWTPNTEEDIKKVLEMKPFAIQTDNIEYFINE